MAGLSKGETKGSTNRSARSCHLREVSPAVAGIFTMERAGVQVGLRHAVKVIGAVKKQLAWDARTESATTRRMSLMVAVRRETSPANDNEFGSLPKSLYIYEQEQIPTLYQC